MFDVDGSRLTSGRSEAEVDTGHAPDGRVMEMLSEHTCQGWLQGYVLTGRHGLFPCYEAFITIVDGMVNQYAKFLKMSRDEAPWREPVVLAQLPAHVGRLAPGPQRLLAPGAGVHQLAAEQEGIHRPHLPAAGRQHAALHDGALPESTGNVNLVIASKHPLPQWLSLDEARHSRSGARSGTGRATTTRRPRRRARLLRADSDDRDARRGRAPSRGRRPTLACGSSTSPTSSRSSTRRPTLTALPQDEFVELFTEDRPVIFDFHGYPSAIHQLIHRRPEQERFHVRGYVEEGTTTTPFDLLAMNGVSRYNLVIEALRRADVGLSKQLSRASGAFAVKTLPDAERIVGEYEKRLVEHRQFIREHGNDPAELLEWSLA